MCREDRHWWGCGGVGPSPSTARGFTPLDAVLCVDQMRGQDEQVSQVGVRDSLSLRLGANEAKPAAEPLQPWPWGKEAGAEHPETTMVSLKITAGGKTELYRPWTLC